jgi:hypothetical protein
MSAPGGEEDELIFHLSELGSASRRSIEDGRGGGASGSSGEKRRGWRTLWWHVLPPALDYKEEYSHNTFAFFSRFAFRAARFCCTLSAQSQHPRFTPRLLMPVDTGSSFSITINASYAAFVFDSHFIIAFWMGMENWGFDLLILFLSWTPFWWVQWRKMGGSYYTRVSDFSWRIGFVGMNGLDWGWRFGQGRM